MYHIIENCGTYRKNVKLVSSSKGFCYTNPMYATLGVEARISLGLDPSEVAKIEDDYRPVDSAEYEDVPFTERERDIVFNPTNTEHFKRRQLDGMADIRKYILGQPYVEEGEIHQRRWPQVAYDPTVESTAYSDLGSIQTLSFKDHGMRIYPLFQFEDSESFRPHPLIAAIHLIAGMQPRDRPASLGNVHRWYRTDRVGLIEAGKEHAELTAREMLVSPDLHHIIIERAIRDRVS
jgi:hypothetical protein